MSLPPVGAAWIEGADAGAACPPGRISAAAKAHCSTVPLFLPPWRQPRRIGGLAILIMRSTIVSKDFQCNSTLFHNCLKLMIFIENKNSRSPDRLGKKLKKTNEISGPHLLAVAHHRLAGKPDAINAAFHHVAATVFRSPSSI
ncbi:hypothetical protein [Phreatobacter sp. AB_2022a]|uniref:hypothetical protein n=1 Tax=Phreatobacter sp. AB_2022a TaxID=3003134 RepID=UPI002286FD2B|nr:hypothetical protein [Phreatobacter sp. AB_2022a]MCZ0732673.1 hypothetical protein [Phreatobacter sp. AB_2022a]